MTRSFNRDVDDDRIDETWTVDEIEWYAMGPFDGKIPGLVRRVRRILDVSQRGLAALLGVSQSVVARWETGRVSPRVSALHALLSLAGLTVEVHDEHGVEVTPMRDDGARDRGDRRYPAHVDLTVRGWWIPRGSETTAYYLDWIRQSRTRKVPLVRFRSSLRKKTIERLLWGTPDDHPARLQLIAEARHLDDRLEDRRECVRAGRSWRTGLSLDLPRSA